MIIEIVFLRLTTKIFCTLKIKVISLVFRGYSVVCGIPARLLICA